MVHIGNHYKEISTDEVPKIGDIFAIADYQIDGIAKTGDIYKKALSTVMILRPDYADDSQSTKFSALVERIKFLIEYTSDKYQSAYIVRDLELAIKLRTELNLLEHILNYANEIADLVKE